MHGMSVVVVFVSAVIYCENYRCHYQQYSVFFPLTSMSFYSWSNKNQEKHKDLYYSYDSLLLLLSNI